MFQFERTNLFENNVQNTGTGLDIDRMMNAEVGHANYDNLTKDWENTGV